jgi:hypothetical protein
MVECECLLAQALVMSGEGQCIVSPVHDERQQPIGISSETNALDRFWREAAAENAKASAASERRTVPCRDTFERLERLSSHTRKRI